MKTIHVLLPFIFLITTLLVSCSQEDESPSPESIPNQEIQTANLKISDNVFVVDSSQLNLISSQTELEQGTYRYSYSSSAPNLTSGTILIGEEDGGYLREVLNVNDNGSEITLQTAQASLEDVFESGNIELSLDLNKGLTKNLSEEVENTVTEQSYEEGINTSNNIDFDINTNFSNKIQLKGGFSFEPTLKFNLDFDPQDGLKEFTFLLDDTKLNLEAGLIFTSNSSAQATIQKNLGNITRRLKFALGGVPVVMDVQVEFLAQGFVDFKQSAEIPITFSSLNTLNYGVIYKNGTNEFVNNSTTNNELAFEPKVEGEANAQIAIIPQINIKLYKVLSNIIKPKPYLELKSQALFEGNENSEICAKIDLGLDLTLTTKAEVFGKEIFDYSKDFQVFDVNVWKSQEDCEIQEVIISDPKYVESTGCGYLWDESHDFSFLYKDDSGTLSEGAYLTALYRFDTGEEGSFTIPWNELTVSEKQIVFKACTNWGRSNYVEQSIFLTNSAGVNSNIITFIRPRSSTRSKQQDSTGQGAAMIGS